MPNYLRIAASDYLGHKVPCTFKATTDSSSDLPTKDDEDPQFDIPDLTKSVTVTVKPKWNAGPLWEETIPFSIASDGSVTVAFDPSVPDVDFRARVQLMEVGNPALRLTMANVKMSRFRDRTKEVLALLNKPPAKRTLLVNPKQWKDPNQPEWKDVDVDEVKVHKYWYGTWPPPNWEISNLPSADFLDPLNPLKSGALNFSPDPSLKVAVNSFVLERAGVRPIPQYFAVTWPKAIAPNVKPTTPAPFLLFIRQTNKRNYFGMGTFDGPGLDPYPENFDYADTGLFESLHYVGSPLRNPNSKGVPYQVSKAGIDVVSVFPCNSFHGEFQDMDDPEETETILREIQAFLFWKDGVATLPTSIGKTVIAAFSSGTFFLHKWLQDDKKRQGHFLSKVVRAVYYLDPMRGYVDTTTKVFVQVLNDFITYALKWADEGTDKRIRLYMQFTWPSLQKLMDKPLPAPPYFATSSDTMHTRTVSVVTSETWSNLLMTKLDPVLWKLLDPPRRPSKPVPWLFIHHAIGATMLTHALAQGDFI
jgi:hypothetical protein